MPVLLFTLLLSLTSGVLFGARAGISVIGLTQ